MDKLSALVTVSNYLIHDPTVSVSYVDSCSLVCLTVPHRVCASVLYMHACTLIFSDVDIDIALN